MTSASTQIRVLLMLTAVAASMVGCTAPPAEEPKPASTFDAAAWEQFADDMWENVAAQHPEAARPEVEFVRYVTLDEWAEVMVACMHDQGFTSFTVSRDGGMESGGFSTEQAGPIDVANYACMLKYPTDPKYNQPLTDERLGALYDYFLNDLKPCLEAEGYEVPDAPSRKTFIETYAESGGWNLYENVGGGSQDAWYDINEKCPQIPEDFYE